MNRIDRLSAILIQLQSKRVVKARDISERFEISLRTVYRDIRALEEAGIPLIGEAGTGYSLSDGYRLPPVMFNREEALAFLTAEKLVEKLTDDGLSATFKSAMYKIKAILRTGEKDLLEQIDSHIEVLKSRPQVQRNLDLNLLQTILQSIAEKKVMSLDYFTHWRQENTKRFIEPVGTFYLDRYWHLIAFCHLRNDYRDFRLDRVSRLNLTSDSFRQDHPPLKKYLQELYRERDLQEVVISCNRQMHKYLDEQKYYNGFVSEIQNGDKVDMTFFTASLSHFARWFLMFGDQACIIKPVVLKEKVRALIDKISSDL
ncbi:helix-turn-helix transcriptional regulator [Rubrolithibacter danxiaensis]|uniref:helix-turn-helix transcriptional regulator n=1 Tax=Rubrolithibacter danxiaensis TaxID=3390805 RepID=UPI003BF79C60